MQEPNRATRGGFKDAKRDAPSQRCKHAMCEKKTKKRTVDSEDAQVESEHQERPKGSVVVED